MCPDVGYKWPVQVHGSVTNVFTSCPLLAYVRAPMFAHPLKMVESICTDHVQFPVKVYKCICCFPTICLTGYQWDYIFDWTILKSNTVLRAPKRSDAGRSVNTQYMFSCCVALMKQQLTLSAPLVGPPAPNFRSTQALHGLGRLQSEVYFAPMPFLISGRS